MDDEQFKRGEAKERLDNIKESVAEIKQAMREHNKNDEVGFIRINEKIDDVSHQAGVAAERADAAAARVKNQETVSNERHDDTKATLKRIETKIDSVANNQATTDKKVAKIYTVAAILGGGAGVLIPRLLDLFISRM